MMYFLFNSRYRISHRCFISWKVTFKTLHFSNSINYSIARFTNRLYVIFEVNKLSNFDLFVFAIFASMYDLALQNLRHWKNLFENSKQYIVEKIKIYIVKKILECVSLRKSFRWKSLHENFKLIRFVKIQNRWHKRLLWKNVKNTIFANVLQSKFNWYNLTKKKLMRFCWN